MARSCVFTEDEVGSVEYQCRELLVCQSASRSASRRALERRVKND